MDNNRNELRRLNVGDVLHLVQIAILLISIGAVYEKLQSASVQVETHTKQLNRIEHYLSTQDSSYWKVSKEVQ